MRGLIAILVVVICCSAIGPGVQTAVAQEPPPATCAKAEFEAVVDEAAEKLRELNQQNRPLFQIKLRELKLKRGWDHDTFLKEAAPFVKDEKIEVFDRSSEELLNAISTMGQAGSTAENPDCALLLELRARMNVLVETQTAKWTYMFEKIDAEMAK